MEFISKSNVINPSKLNKERAQHKGTQKTTDYVQFQVYLPTKWAINETDYTYIQLKRSAAFECNNSFTKLFRSAENIY